jgi:single-stranded-DNA-specific exonuclease
VLDHFSEMNPLLVQVLANRGLHDPQEIQSFLAGEWPAGSGSSGGDPFALRDMDRAVDVLIRAIKRRDRIAIYGDFDADGVTATALLVQTLTGLGADVRPYIPRRVEEGYGLNVPALRKLYKDGVRLVVTVDCGIRAVEEIEQARRGLEIIVTDHHTVGPELPYAMAVIDPKREDCPYPFKKLAGVGVAFKLAQALIREAPADSGRTSHVDVHVGEQSLLDLVALGTVSDLVPLMGENRILVRRGLGVLNEARREGVRALLRVARLRPGDVSASSIGYGLGPRLNAAGRLGDALLSYKLLVTGDEREAERLAGRLNDRNRLRQELTAQAYELAEGMALSADQDVPLLFAAHKGFQSGIVGLVAGRLTDAYYRPAVVVEKGEETCKGSCRSIAEFHITRALDECRDLLVRHGGHEAAAGFTVRTENLDPLAERLTDIAWRELGGALRSEELAPKIEIDALVPLAAMDWEAVEWLQQMEPCGEENPTPVFLSRGVPIVRAQAVGAEGRHLRLSLADGEHPADRVHPADGEHPVDIEHPAEGEQARDAIAFRQGHRLEGLGERVDVVYSLEVNEWNGERRLQLNVQDIRPAED